MHRRTRVRPRFNVWNCMGYSTSAFVEVYVTGVSFGLRASHVLHTQRNAAGVAWLLF